MLSYLRRSVRLKRLVVPNAFSPRPDADRRVIIKDVLWQAELET